MDRFIHSLRQVVRIDAVLVLPTVLFLVVYLSLRDGAPFGVPALVWACCALVIASAVVRLPVHRRLLAGHAEAVPLSVAAWLAVGMIVAMQLAQADPVFSQRLWTLSLAGLAAGYLVVYLAGWPVERLPIPWRRNVHAHSVVLPMEILRLMGFAVVNEAIVAGHDEPLWVSARALMPILLTPVVRWVTLMVLLAREVETQN